MDEVKALAYFSSLNSISRKIAHPQSLLVKYLGNKWSEYSPEQQGELFNDLCVPQSARFEQSSIADDSGLPSCWPTLKLPSGEKIIVDENDIWTWRDEHSGPFSWKSKSQQDLTLLDLEPDNLTKPHGKGHKSTSESEEPASPTVPVSRPKLLPNPDSWTQAVLADFTINCQEEIESPVYEAPTLAVSEKESPAEEVNPAFEGSVEDLSPSASPTHDVGAPQPLQKQHLAAAMPVQATQSRAQTVVMTESLEMTPPHKKLSQPGLGKKDGKGLSGKLAIDSSQQMLIVHNKEEEKGTAFTNPVMEVEWSNFVGQSSTDPGDEDNDSVQSGGNQTDDSPAPVNPIVSPLVKEPIAMVMDRGGGLWAGEDSAESTPDHTTQLLKKTVAEALVKEEIEKEEVVYVVDEGSGDVSVSSKLVATPEGSIPRSGFDFLDNW